MPNMVDVPITDNVSKEKVDEIPTQVASDAAIPVEVDTVVNLDKPEAMEIDEKPINDLDILTIKDNRLIIINGMPKYQYTQVQLEDLKSDTTDIIDFQELGNLDETKKYYYLNICIEYSDEFENHLKFLNQFINGHEAWIKSFHEIGYHITLDSNKKSWSEFETEKTEYLNFLTTLKVVHDKVTHVSILDKYDSSLSSVTDEEELKKINQEIQTDIENWDNLKVFDYGNNYIKSLHDIKFPDTIEVINIGHSTLETLSGFQLPENLTTLILNNNLITSIDNIKFPSNLKYLDLSGNHVYFLNYVDWPTKLETLDLSNNRIDNIRNIDFPNNLKVLNLSFNPIDNLKGCKFPDHLNFLDVSFIPNESMTGIKFPDYLESLNLQQSMTNTRGLKLPNLVKYLNLGGNGVNSINPLKLPNSIEYLNLNNNNIKTLNKVIFPSNLKKLFIGNNLITTLKNVTFPESLNELNIEMDPDAMDNDKRISNLKDLILPSNLQILKLGYQSIKTLESIELPLNLQELDLSFNELKLLRNVGFGNLKRLNISGNQELIEIDQILLPPTLNDLKIPSQLIPNLPSYIIEKANQKELLISKSLPY